MKENYNHDEKKINNNHPSSHTEHVVMPASFRHRDRRNFNYHFTDRFSFMAHRYPFL